MRCFERLFILKQLYFFCNLIILFVFVFSTKAYCAGSYEDFESYNTGDLDSQGDWTGSTLVDVQDSTYASGSQAVSMPSHTSTDGAAKATLSLSVTGYNNRISFYMRDSNVAASNYTAVFYVYEGSSIIMTVAFYNSKWHHLCSSGWEEFGSASVSDTWYKVEVYLTTTTHGIIIDGVAQTLTHTGNYTNGVTAPDSIVIQRYAKNTTGTSYFDRIYIDNAPVLYGFANYSQLDTSLDRDVAITASGANMEYLVTDTTTTPETDDADWQTSATVEITADDYGTETFYAWAMNTVTEEISDYYEEDFDFYEGSSEYKNLVTLMPGTRYASNPIIEHVASTWKGRQVHFPYVIVNPWDSTELLQYYGGGDYLTEDYKCGVATADVSDPYDWTEYASNPVISPPATADFVIGVHYVVYNSTEDTLWLYAAVIDSSPVSEWQGLWKSDSEDPYTFTYYGAVISPSGDEIRVGDAGYLLDDGTLYCYYGYRTATATLPGLRLATSTNGTTFTKQSGNILSLGPSGSYDDKYIESGQAFKIGTSYVVGYSSYDGTTNCDGDWTCSYAVSDSPSGPFYKDENNPIFAAGDSGEWDDTYVSTNFNFQYGGNYYFFYQGTGATGTSPDCYNASLWDMGMTTVKISDYVPRISIY